MNLYLMEELHTDSIDGGHEGQLWARSRARERAYSNIIVGKSSNSKLMSRIFRLTLNRPIFFKSNLSLGLAILTFRRNK